ncbi:hypothetical protein ZHAS_00004832 [Anopheles sinensis]|uniref:Uncharacterized protein n=1 Tax=Anopheles sinensis TaxID=74873 RepID=A0A084VHZ7_ANOSI|nr:hypothetical protein ZHAS_00004832 [Anopheles sinensis]
MADPGRLPPTFRNAGTTGTERRDMSSEPKKVTVRRLPGRERFSGQTNRTSAAKTRSPTRLVTTFGGFMI